MRDFLKKCYFRWAIGSVTSASGTRKTSSRHKKKPTCTPPKPLQPQLRLVEVHPGEVRLSLEVEGPVAEKVLQGSKASKNKNSFSWMTPKFYQDFATTKKDDEISRQKRKKHFYKLQRLAAIFFLTFFKKKNPPFFLLFLSPFPV